MKSTKHSCGRWTTNTMKDSLTGNTNKLVKSHCLIPWYTTFYSKPDIIFLSFGQASTKPQIQSMISLLFLVY